MYYDDTIKIDFELPEYITESQASILRKKYLQTS